MARQVTGKQSIEAKRHLQGRRAYVMDLLSQDWDVDSIAERLQVDRSTVYRDIKVMLDAAAAQCPHTAHYRQVQFQRLQVLIEAWMPIAANPARLEVGLAALHAVNKLFQQEARLMGTYRPIKHEVTAKREGMKDVTPNGASNGKANSHRRNGNGAI